MTYKYTPSVATDGIRFYYNPVTKEGLADCVDIMNVLGINRPERYMKRHYPHGGYTRFTRLTPAGAIVTRDVVNIAELDNFIPYNDSRRQLAEDVADALHCFAWECDSGMHNEEIEGA